MIKPKALKPGDTIATVSLSWGGAGLFPHRYEACKRQLMDAFGVRVVEMPHALRSPDWIARNPRARANDLMKAPSDPAIHGIITCIGGAPADVDGHPARPLRCVDGTTGRRSGCHQTHPIID